MARIEAFCGRHHIRRMAIFGSALREDFGPKSDIDRTRADLDSDRTLTLALTRLVEILGEAANRVSERDSAGCAFR
ncbi:MAG TPA: hypothetical protein VFY93_05085 [Planctomycetota bacterium]|nr:hypothetical protein [Planctomycetota bacterium]